MTELISKICFNIHGLCRFMLCSHVPCQDSLSWRPGPETHSSLALTFGRPQSSAGWSPKVLVCVVATAAESNRCLPSIPCMPRLTARPPFPGAYIPTQRPLTLRFRPWPPVAPTARPFGYFSHPTIGRFPLNADFPSTWL